MNKQIIRNISVAVSALAVCGLAGLLAVQYASYSKVQHQWQAKKQEMVNLTAEIEEIKQSINDYQKEEEEFKKLLFNERDVPAFLDEISKYAKMASMNIIDMKTQQFYQVQVPQELQDARGMNKNIDRQLTEQEKKEEMQRAYTLAAMPIQVKVKGSFASFVQFLDHLQEYNQLLNIANVEINTTREYPVLDCQFMIRIYSLKTLGELQHL